MKIPFTKMHGAGNDYIYIDCTKDAFDPEFPQIAELAKQMSHRHFSVGADGVVLICPSEKADARMRMFNADGSEGKMCGNAIRCVGKYLYDSGMAAGTRLTIETLSGIRQLSLDIKEGVVSTVSVDMGKARFAPEDIPTAASGELIDYPIWVGGAEYHITALSMGNPHAVVFMENIDNMPIETIGPLFENHPLFPERVNTEFIEPLGGSVLKMRVWERGSGETWACGTGACAAAAAAVRLGRQRMGVPITLKLLGGELIVQVDEDYGITMTGGAVKAYEGVYEYKGTLQ